MTVKTYDLETWRCKNCIYWLKCRGERNPSRASGLRQPDDYGCVQFETGEPIIEELPGHRNYQPDD